MELDPEEDSSENGWIPHVLPTVATSGEGILDLVNSLTAHYEYLKSSGIWQVREKKRLKNQLETLLGSALRSRWEKRIAPDIYQAALAQVINRELSPWRAVEELISGAGL
jgi:LAO/AO transport system kinase